MKYISHRGNLIGPYPDLENRPDYVQNALDSGFDCECDVWWKNDTWWLGHDKAQYPVSAEFIFQKRLWLHAKNTEALHRLRRWSNTLNFFWHETDAYTLTSQGYIWAYPGSKLTSETICVMPENADPLYTRDEKNACYGIC